MKSKIRNRWGLLALWVLGSGFAMHMVGNAMWVIAPWAAALLTLRFVRSTSVRVGLPLGAAGWALAYCAGWAGVLPLNGWVAWALPALVGVIAFVPFAIDRVLGGYVPKGTRWLVLPMSWVATEAAFRLLGFGTWGAAGYSQHALLPFMQGVSLLGMAWPALVIGAFASIGNALWEQPRRAWKPALAFAVVLVAFTAFGFARLNIETDELDSVWVAGVVVDNREAFKATWGPLNYGKVLDGEALNEVRPTADALFQKLLLQTEQAVGHGAKIVVWSEGNALVPRADMDRLIASGQQLAREHGIWLFMSMAVMEEGQPKARNMLVVVDDRGSIIDRYLKSHPTPGEASVKGDGVMRVADTPYGRIAWAICYDFDYPELIAQAGRANAQLLIDPSWDSKGMTPLHSQMATLRSIETGAALFRVVNDGLSIAVDGRGQTLSALPLHYGDNAVWTVRMPIQKHAALYPWIEPFVGIAAGLGVIGLVAMGRPSRRRGVNQ